jgi:hypothetical protein
MHAGSRWTDAKTQELESRDRIGLAHLTPSQEQSVRFAARKEFDFCGKDPFPGQTQEVIYQHMGFKRVDLAEQKTGYVVQGWGVCMCGAVGNCPFWVFDSDMKVILKDGAQTFAILPNITNGQYDLVLREHDSASESDWTLYQFTGKLYKKTRCADVNFSPTPNVVLKKPVITAVSCKTWKPLHAK